MILLLPLLACLPVRNPAAPPIPDDAPMSASAPDPAAAPAPAAPAARTANATLEPRSNSTVTGTVTFRQVGADVTVDIAIAGATPGDHAVHVHEKGDCSAADATSAGGHFNPEQAPHGDATMPQHHPGDFGNVTVAADGTGKKQLTTTSLTLSGGVTSVAGLSVVVHEKADDFSQPVGNAGARQACGVITAQ